MPRTPQPHLSVVIPVYNERSNLEPLFERLTVSLALLGKPYELIMVDDNSTDGSFEYAESRTDLPLRVYRKRGNRGKAFSLIQGIAKARGKAIAFIDADLQYPPEALVPMTEMLDHCDIVVANRSNSKTPLYRTISSRLFRFVFGFVLLGIRADVQSGLKVFKKSTFKSVQLDPTAWGFDYQFLFKARRGGASIGSYTIKFSKRLHGESQISTFSTAWELMSGSVALRGKTLVSDAVSMLRKFSLSRLIKSTLLILLAGVTVATFVVRPPADAIISAPPEPVAPVAINAAYTVKGTHIFQGDKEIELHGISWFGFETKDHTAHGLWTRNWKDMISQMKDLGFNAVRLPFCPATLSGSPVTSINYDLNPDLKGLASDAVLTAVMQELNRQHMYILLDHHTFDCQSYGDLWYTDTYSEADWVHTLTTAATKYEDLPYFMGIDLKNEPHGAITWGLNKPKTDWNLAVQRAGKAVLTANPNLLVFMQGIYESAYCSPQKGNFWGSNLQPFACAPIDPAFIPKNKLVLSPHVYGPDLASQSYFYDRRFPANMPAVWTNQFGFAAKQGSTLVPGEWGGKYGLGKPKDKPLLDALVNYFLDNHLCSSFYWAWNPNNNDIGGLLEDDWRTPYPSKMSLLSHYFETCKP